MLKTLDWLQFSAKISFFPIISNDINLRVEKTDKQTRFFKDVHEVFWKETRIAILLSQPRAKIIDENLVICKIENKLLYVGKTKQIVGLILDGLYLKFHNWTRIDIAIDLEGFIDYPNPERFIYDFLREKIVHRNKGQFSVHGKHNLKNDYETLTFGTGYSDVKVRLYNKTIEMNEKKMKSWILETWKENRIGIDKNVWRLEFQLNNFNMNVVNKESGELEAIKGFRNPLMFLDNDFLNVLISQYFSFCYNRGESRKDRMGTVQLFKGVNNYKKLVSIDGMGEGGKSEKVFLKKLHFTMGELRIEDMELKNDVMKFRNKVIFKTGLQEWFNKRVEYW